MKFIHFHFCAFLLFFLSLSPVLAQSPQGALDSSKKLQAKVIVGISFSDYCRELGETLYQVDRFISSPAGKKSPVFSEHIRKAFGHYLMAKSLWQVKFHAEDRYTQEGFYIVEDAFMQEALKIYPKLTSKIRIIPNFPNRVIYLQDILTIIWQQADREIKLAEFFL